MKKRNPPASCSLTDGLSAAVGAHNPKVAGSNPAPATMKNDGLADAAAASPFRLPRLHPGIGAPLGPHGATRLPEVNEAEGEWPLTRRVPAQIMRCMSPMTDFNRSRPVSSMGITLLPACGRSALVRGLWDCRVDVLPNYHRLTAA